MYTNLFLDSGAYSSKRSGTPIVLNDYIAFIQEHKDTFTIYANLDVIGDYKETWNNQRIMEKQGLNPMPVFHMEDPMECLDWCLKYDYFALGGMANASMKDRIRFFDKCWNIICDKDGYPKSKIHGFGMGSPQLIKQYPWFSVDGSSWVSYGRYGIVIMPKREMDGNFNYFVPPVKVFVTDKSTKKGLDGFHYSTLSIQEKIAFDSYLIQNDIPFGDEENKGVFNDNFWRDLTNCLFFTNMCNNVQKYPWQWIRPSIQTFF